MNKKLIVAAVSAAVVAPVASHAAEVTAYGNVTNAIDINDVSSKDDAESTTDLSGVSSRLGFRASSDLGNGLTGHGRYEFETTTDKEGGGIEDTRVATVGLSGAFGRIDVGNQWSAYNATFGTLVSPTYSLGYYLYSSVGGGVFRASNTIKYSNTFGPLHAQLDVRLNDSGETADNAEKLRGEGIGLGLSFAVTDNITIAAAFDSEDGADRATVGGTAQVRARHLVSADYNPGNAAVREAVDVVDVNGVEKTFVAVTTAGTDGGRIDRAEIGATAVAATGSILEEDFIEAADATTAKLADTAPDTDRMGLAIKGTFGNYWVSLGWQNYSVGDDERTAADDEVDLDTTFLYGGGSLGEKTSWLLGFSQADDSVETAGKDAVTAAALVEGVGSATDPSARVRGSLAVTAAAAGPASETDDSSQVTWGIFHKLGGGMTLFYEGTTVESENKEWDGGVHLLGMRVNF